ncbi:hypothetical protein E4U56_002193 [Claviceps arundinis]|uniref:Uncharacterized protein n=1 Tax=Claviceps arundinis TaxID=1623583 RepID=A0A9P7MXZ7_9HYPO|nr:hypothetical protein E4U56_002193 [Claviceps arundinis]
MSGGFYKYRCKYFYTHDCQNWVWMNNAPCATCLAEGRDDEMAPIPVSMINRDISVPYVHDGVLQYALMEVAVSAEPSDYWTVTDMAARPPPAIPVMSAMPESLFLVPLEHDAQPSDCAYHHLPHRQRITNYRHARMF